MVQVWVLSQVKHVIAQYELDSNIDGVLSRIIVRLVSTQSLLAFKLVSAEVLQWFQQPRRFEACQFDCCSWHYRSALTMTAAYWLQDGRKSFCMDRLAPWHRNSRKYGNIIIKHSSSCETIACKPQIVSILFFCARREVVPIGGIRIWLTGKVTTEHSANCRNP